MPDTSEPLFTLEIAVRKIAQAGVEPGEDEIIVRSKNLSQAEVTAMRSELLPILENFNKTDLPTT